MNVHEYILIDVFFELELEYISYCWIRSLYITRYELEFRT